MSLESNVFKTSRTIVRPLKMSDIVGFYDMQSNENVMRFIKPKMNLVESRKELRRFIKLENTERQFYEIWAIESDDNSQFLGICGVYENDKKEIEIAYRFRERFWGQGYGSEIAEALRVRDYLYPKSIPSDEMDAIGGGQNFEKNISSELIPKINKEFRAEKNAGLYLDIPLVDILCCMY